MTGPERQQLFLVWSNEHGAWWNPQRCGYTQEMAHAGRYTLAEAIAICEPNNYRAGSRLQAVGAPAETMFPDPGTLESE